MAEKTPWLVKLNGETLGITYAASDASSDEVEKAIRLLFTVVKPLTSECRAIAVREAAPELLAACKALVAALGDIEMGENLSACLCRGSKAQPCAYCQGEAAVAKAEGK